MKKLVDGILSEELHQWIEAKKSLVIIDTLSAELFRQRHLPGARNACVFEVTFPDQVKAVVSVFSSILECILFLTPSAFSCD